MTETRPDLPIGDAFRFGWEAVRTHFVFLVGLAFLILMTIAGALAVILLVSGTNEALASLLGTLLQLAANTILPAGGIALALKLCDRVPPRWEDFLPPMKTLIFYFIGSLIYGAFVGFGLLLLIVPGVYFGIRFSLMGYYIVDGGSIDPIEAIRRSWEATEGQVLNLLLFWFSALAVNLAGLLALFIGLFVTGPLTMVAAAYVYRDLENRRSQRPFPGSCV